MSLKTSDGRLYVVSGASRSGKTAWTARQVRSLRRVLAWDPEDQWSKLPGFVRIDRPGALIAAADNPNPLKVAYVPGPGLKADFELFCHSAFHWGRFHGGGAVIAEELADVSTPAKAPGGWGVLVRRGLKRGLSIYAISQRWSEADKTAFGNASEFVVFRCSSLADVQYIARRTRLEAAALETLKPLEYLRLDAATGEIRREKLRF